MMKRSPHTLAPWQSGPLTAPKLASTSGITIHPEAIRSRRLGFTGQPSGTPATRSTPKKTFVRPVSTALTSNEAAGQCGCVRKRVLVKLLAFVGRTEGSGCGDGSSSSWPNAAPAVSISVKTRSRTPGCYRRGRRAAREVFENDSR